MFKVISGGELIDGLDLQTGQDLLSWADSIGATVEMGYPTVIITLSDGSQITVVLDVQPGHGSNEYNDDLGDLIPTIDAQGVIPPVMLQFGLIDPDNEIILPELESHVAPVEDVVEEQCVIEIPETPSCDVNCGDIIYNALTVGFDRFLNTENNIYDPIGTSGNDFILTKAPVSFGFGGDDVLISFGGYNNLRWGGNGDDVVLDFFGYNNYLLGGNGDDIVASVFGYGNILWGGDGNDTLIALGNGNILAGGDGNDTLLAIGGNNLLFGGDGDDILIAKNGEFEFDDEPNWIGGEGGQYEEDGNLLWGGDGNDCLFGADYVNDILVGGDGNDYLDGGQTDGYYAGGYDKLFGGSGNDTLVAYGDGEFYGQEGDYLYGYNYLDGYYNGGDGFDRLDLSNAGNFLSNFYNVDNIEQLDMEDGDNDIMMLNAYDIIDMTDYDNELFITGDNGDKLYLTGVYENDNSEYRDEPIEENEWTTDGEVCQGTDGNEYVTYTYGDMATIHVDTDINVNTNPELYAVA